MKLTTNARKHIASSNFALPGRRYPIHDLSHARAALAMVAKYGTPAEQKIVRNKVKRKYPKMFESTDICYTNLMEARSVWKRHWNSTKKGIYHGALRGGRWGATLGTLDTLFSGKVSSIPLGVVRGGIVGGVLGGTYGLLTPQDTLPRRVLYRRRRR